MNKYKFQLCLRFISELKATIVGPTDLYVKSGSDINLTCKIMQGPHELGNIFWYKGKFRLIISIHFKLQCNLKYMYSKFSF